jgi:F0F1-type ATP synthase assembly protein I
MTGPPKGGAGPPVRRPGAAPSGAEYAGAGLSFALTLVVFMFLGIWLDRKLGSSPWFVIICVFVGAGAAFYSLYRKLVGAAGKGAGTARDRTGGGGGGKRG